MKRSRSPCSPAVKVREWGCPKDYSQFTGSRSSLICCGKLPGPAQRCWSRAGREHPPGCEKFSIEVTDPQAQGPLRGILTGLENLMAPIVVVITVDMPGVRIEQVRWLVDHLAKQPQTLGIMCRRMGESCDCVEPFPSIYRREGARRSRNAFQAARGRFMV